MTVLSEVICPMDVTRSVSSDIQNRLIGRGGNRSKGLRVFEAALGLGVIEEAYGELVLFKPKMC